jgi:hypothetical protein
LYWYAMWPFHLFIFRGMAKKIINYHSSNVTSKHE